MKPGEFKAMLAAEDRHWWYVGRRLIVRRELAHLQLGEGARLLDAGCGSGRMLDELADYGAVTGIDISPQGVHHARERGHVNVVRGDISDLPYDDASFDLVTCFDVIEHVPDDHKVLAELFRVTRPGGHVMLTVPAYQWLWSQHDVANDHYRRYNSKQLRHATRDCGLVPIRDTYFNSILFLPAALVRLLRSRRQAPGRVSELAMSGPVLNRLLQIPLRFESTLLGHRLRLPVGLSLLAVLQRPAGAELRDYAKHSATTQFVKFAVVGLSNTGLSFAAYALAVSVGVPYLIASVGAFSLGAVNGYWLNRVWTFSAGGFRMASFLRYVCVQLIGLAFNAISLLTLVDGLGVDRIAGQAIVLPAVSLLTFGLNRSWAFRAGQVGQQSAT